MNFNGIPQFNIEDLTVLYNNNNCSGNFGLDGFDYMDPSNVAGPSQTYTGVDVQGNLSSYPEFLTPSTAPVSLNPAYGVHPNEGKSRRASQ